MAVAANKPPSIAKRLTDTEKAIAQSPNRTTWAEVGILWALYLVTISIPPTIATVNYLSYRAEQIAASPAARWLGLSGEGRRGDNAQGHTFASPVVGKSLQDLVNYKPSFEQSFGPETGAMRSYGPHAGVDFDDRVGAGAGAALASPINGKITAITRIATSANGPSYQLHIEGEDWQGPLEHRLTHVDSLMVSQGDRVTAGQLVARVSPTDSVSSGAHLHWEIRRGGQPINPQTWAAEAIKQNRNRDRGKPLSTSDGFPIDAYVQAISRQESGHSYAAVNPHSGALGRYQFMPATKASVAQACPSVGRVPSRNEFLSSSELQDQIMRCKVERDLKTIQRKSDDINTQCRMMSSTHYSGNPDLWNNRRPQTYNGASYPSIAAYTQSVCRGIE